MASFINSVKPFSALSALQNKYALLDLAGEIRIIDKQQVNDVLIGKRPEISFYKRTEGLIVISRELENLPYSVKASDEFKSFLVNPKTHVYNAVAFSPLATPPSTLNYWIEPPIKPVQGDWFVIQEFIHTVICNNWTSHAFVDT